ncbi:MAG: RecX family transcriptional regulator, partial [Hyphomicrobiaceae bacterium]
RPVTATYLRNSAMHYLSARSASTTMLRQTLERRAKTRLCVRQLSEETRALIDKAIGELVTLGMVNDATFAQARARSLQGKGFSKRRITEGLRLKGIGGAQAALAIDPELDELTQARRFAERKRLGAWRRGGPTPETRDKDLRALARAGFAYAIASKALVEAED